MADHQHDNAVYNFATMDWVAYVTHRPIYPAALYDLIFTHHAAHSGQFDSALDVGAGIGVVAAELLPHFAHVTVSDPSALYISQAQAAFAHASAAAPGENARVSFVQRRIEDLVLDDLPHGDPVDLITAAECLHWADMEAVGPRVAALLRPGGTFAAWIYGAYPSYPTTHPEGRAALAAFMTRYFDLCERHVTGPQTDADSRAAHFNARLDSMPLNPGTWADVRRIHTLETETMISAKAPTAASRVKAETETVEVGEDALLSREADYAWLEGYLANLMPPLNVQQTCAEELRALKEVMGARKVLLQWPLGIVLATRRSS